MRTQCEWVSTNFDNAIACVHYYNKYKINANFPFDIVKYHQRDYYNFTFIVVNFCKQKWNSSMILLMYIFLDSWRSKNECSNLNNNNDNNGNIFLTHYQEFSGKTINNEIKK